MRKHRVGVAFAEPAVLGAGRLVPSWLRSKISVLPRPIWPSFLGSEASCSLVCFRCLAAKSASCSRAKRAISMWLLLSSGVRLSLGSFFRTSRGARSSSSSGSVPELPAARRHGLSSGVLRTRSLFWRDHSYIQPTLSAAAECCACSVVPGALRASLQVSAKLYKLLLRCLRAYLRFEFQA